MTSCCLAAQMMLQQQQQQQQQLQPDAGMLGRQCRGSNKCMAGSTGGSYAGRQATGSRELHAESEEEAAADRRRPRGNSKASAPAADCFASDSYSSNELLLQQQH
ncbi:hypothetical protein Efla_005754 [Eimeria flavescens]